MPELISSEIFGGPCYCRRSRVQNSNLNSFSHPGHLISFLCAPIPDGQWKHYKTAHKLRSAKWNVDIVSYANEASNMILLRFEFLHAWAKQQIHGLREHAKTYLRNHNLVRTSSCAHSFGSFVIPQRFRLVDESTHLTQSLSKHRVHNVKCGPHRTDISTFIESSNIALWLCITIRWGKGFFWCSSLFVWFVFSSVIVSTLSERRPATHSSPHFQFGKFANGPRRRRHACPFALPFARKGTTVMMRSRQQAAPHPQLQIVNAQNRGISIYNTSNNVYRNSALHATQTRKKWRPKTETVESDSISALVNWPALVHQLRAH